MESVNLNALRRRARVAYEWGRMRQALIGSAPVLLLAALAAWLGGKPSETAPFGVGLLLAGVAAFSYGREPKRAVLPGIAAGLIPLGLAAGMMRVGYMCFGDRCTSACMAACVIGGAGAGLAVGLVGLRRRYGWPFWFAASTVAFLTGAMSCSCLGYAGLAGLATGYAMGAVPALALRAVRR